MENVYVEKSPKKGATWKQANKVAMHMTDTGVPTLKILSTPLKNGIKLIL